MPDYRFNRSYNERGRPAKPYREPVKPQHHITLAPFRDGFLVFSHMRLVEANDPPVGRELTKDEAAALVRDPDNAVYLRTAGKRGSPKRLRLPPE